jgi:hypothetical protein
MEPRKVIATYTTVTFKPNRERRRAIMTGLRTGDAKRNAMIGPKGTPPFSRPAVIGTVEQEQKGVTAPRPEPRKYCTHVNLLERKSLMRDGGRYSISMPTRRETAIKIRISSPEMIRKNLPAVRKLLVPNIQPPV